MNSTQQSNHPSSTPVSFLREFSFARRGENQPINSTRPPPVPPQNQTTPLPTQDVTVLARTSIVVSHRQRGNPVLAHIRNVKWVFGEIVPDYLLGQNTCALFLSLRYHLLHPDYIFTRIRELQKAFRLRVILCHVDSDDVTKPLHDITKTALLHDCTLLCAWSMEECARYLETVKSYENKPASIIQERTENDYVSRITGALTSIRHVNKTDSLTLCQNFGTLSAVLQAPMEELVSCPGIGEKKVRRIHDTFHEPFRRRAPKAPKPAAAGLEQQPTTTTATAPPLALTPGTGAQAPEDASTSTRPAPGEDRGNDSNDVGAGQQRPCNGSNSETGAGDKDSEGEGRPQRPTLFVPGPSAPSAGRMNRLKNGSSGCITQSLARALGEK